MEIRRLRGGDGDTARVLFETMADVFEEPREALSDPYIDALLDRVEFWALAAHVAGELVGGLTAHTLPLTRREQSEVFIYDIAVVPAYQRKGVGRGLVEELRRIATADGVGEIFVPADNDDTHALDFYRALGGEPSPVTIFTFPGGRA